MHKKNSSRPRSLAIRMMLAAALAFAALLTGCGGGGGGGGGGSVTNVTVTGKVLRAETNQPPNPQATVAIGGVSAPTGTDGTFTLTGVPSNSTTASVTAQGAAALSLPVSLSSATNGTVSLGTVYLSDTGYTANVNGVVVTQDKGQVVGGAAVTVAGQSTVTKTDGTFSLSGLPVGLGNVAGEVVGQITAPGFDVKQITSEILGFPLAAGANNIGKVVIASSVSSGTPLPPYTITGTVQSHGAAAAGVPVTLMQNKNVLGTTSTDPSGAYFFWVVPGTYHVTAVQGAASVGADVTLVHLDQPVSAPVLNF